MKTFLISLLLIFAGLFSACSQTSKPLDETIVSETIITLNDNVGNSFEPDFLYYAKDNVFVTINAKQNEKDYPLLAKIDCNNNLITYLHLIEFGDWQSGVVRGICFDGQNNLYVTFSVLDSMINEFGLMEINLDNFNVNNYYRYFYSGSLPQSDQISFANQQVWITDINKQNRELIYFNIQSKNFGSLKTNCIPHYLCYDGIYLWASDGLKSLLKINPITNSILSQYEYRIFNIVYANQGIWASPYDMNDGKLIKIDIISGTIKDHINFGQIQSGSGIYTSNNKIWIGFAQGMCIYEVNLSNMKYKRIKVSFPPNNIVFDGERLWATNYSDNNIRIIHF